MTEGFDDFFVRIIGDLLRLMDLELSAERHSLRFILRTAILRISGSVQSGELFAISFDSLFFCENVGSAVEYDTFILFLVCSRVLAMFSKVEETETSCFSFLSSCLKALSISFVPDNCVLYCFIDWRRLFISLRNSAVNFFSFSGTISSQTFPASKPAILQSTSKIAIPSFNKIDVALGAIAC